jgi:DNA-binding response OmpR family regulator
VLAAPDATTALAIIRMRPPHVICLDVQMPDAGDGLKLCETIAADPSLSEIPLVILTGQADPETIIRCAAMGAYYVEKCPEIWDRLEPLLKELLDVPPTPAAVENGRASMPSTGDAPSEALSSVATSEPQDNAGDHASNTASTVCTERLDEAVAIPSTPVPTAVIQAGEEESIGPSDSQPETERDPAPERIEIEGEFPDVPETVWTHITQAVERLLTRTQSPDADESFVAPAGTAIDTEALEEAMDPVQSDFFAVPESAAAEKEAVPDCEPVSPVPAATDERVPCQPAPHEAARLADLDKAWATIEKSRPAPQPPIEQRAVPMSQKREGEVEKTILIADDDGDLVQMLALRCKQMGLRVFRSPDAMHALMGVNRVRPDLLVLDVNMPGGNGLSVCEMLSGDEKQTKIPIIIMTGDTSEEMARRCHTLHAQYVPKGAGLWDRLEPAIRNALDLPERPSSKETSSQAASETTPGRRLPKILVIDDDPEISKILKFRLERYGVDVLRAFSGMQGYWTALDMRPDMIILDMVMPDGSGNYVFGRLRSHPLTEKVPVLMLTGVNTPGVRRQMFGLGVDAYLTKPIDFMALLEHVRQYVPLRDDHPATKRDQAAAAAEDVTTEFLEAGLKHATT